MNIPVLRVFENDTFNLADSQGSDQSDWLTIDSDTIDRHHSMNVSQHDILAACC